MLMSPEMIRRLEAAGLRRAIFSMCGATEGLHEYLQHGVVSERVWSNFAACAQSGIETWALYVLMRSNLEELGAFAQRVHDSGGRYVVIEQIYVSDGHPLAGDMLRQHPEAVRRYLPQAERLAESLGVTVERRYDASLMQACSPQ
jgi:pyruvate-formate lyase-activating enzyme